MPVFEPLTDGVKAFREFIRALQDLAALLGRFGHHVEQRRRRDAARCLATLYFDPAWIPSILQRVAATEAQRQVESAKSQSLQKDSASLGHDDPDSPAPQLTLFKKRALIDLNARLEKTAFSVVDAFVQLEQFRTFIRERFGLSYYSADYIASMKGDIRQHLKQFSGEVDVDRLSDSEIDRQVYDLQEMIVKFNQVISDLHDRLLDIPGTSQRKDASASPNVRKANTKKSGAANTPAKHAARKTGRPKPA